MIKLSLYSIIAAFGIIVAMTPGQTREYPWCSQRTDESRAHSCAFDTWEQCMATMSGIGGYCYLNYALPLPSPVIAPSRKRHRIRPY